MEGHPQSSSPEVMTGRCLCGAVRFRVTPPTLWSAHCHCTLCQRAHGAAFVTWVGAASDRSEILEQEHGDLVWYHSSEQAERGFCRRCGTTLFFRSSRWPGELHCTRASFEGAVDREPAAHAFWETHVAWFPFEDELAKKVSE